MKITSIEAQKKARGRVNVFVDREYRFALPEKLLVDFDLYEGKEVTDKEIENFMTGDLLSKCLDKAYRFLSFRPRSEKEMRDKLLEKYDEKTVEEAIGRLKEYNFINDSDFSRMWVSSRLSGRSKKALAFELSRKGIDKVTIEGALADITGDTEFAAALALVTKRSKYQGLSRDEAYKKIAPFLSRRGYGYDVIKKVIDETQS